MKQKLYTQSYSPELVQKIGNNGNLITAEEHAFLTRSLEKDRFSSAKDMVDAYVAENSGKLESVSFLSRHMVEHKLDSALSLGAGPCVLEQLLSQAISGRGRVIAADFDAHLVERARSLFPSLTVLKFDFVHDDLNKLVRDHSFRGVSIFWGSSYVMDDRDFVRVFGGLREAGARWVIDFHPACLNWKDVLKSPLTWLKGQAVVRKLFDRGPRGLFHGFLRDRSLLRRLYRQAGFEIARETSVGSYKYVAVCRNPKEN